MINQLYCTEQKLLHFFFENINLSQMPTDSHVLIRFVIKRDGTISHAEVQKCSDESFEKEIMRIMHLMKRKAGWWGS